MSERTFVLIVASTWRQAQVVCEKLDLPRPNHGPNDGDVTTIYAGPRDLPRIRGLLPDRVIVARPVLVTGVDWEYLDGVELAAEHRLLRTNAGKGRDTKPEFVFT